MNLLLQLVLIILVVVLVALIVLAILWILRQRKEESAGSGQPPARKHDDCCVADAKGHCGKIRLPKGFAPIGDDDPPNRWPTASLAGGGQNINSGIRVQVIAAGFFDPLALPREPVEHIEPIVTIHNQGTNMMYVGRYFQHPTYEGFATHFRVPPGASVTVTWWQLWSMWIGGSSLSPLPANPGSFIQLGVTGKDAKGCYVISWCCPRPKHYCCSKKHKHDEHIDPITDSETGTDIETGTRPGQPG